MCFFGFFAEAAVFQGIRGGFLMENEGVFKKNQGFTATFFWLNIVSRGDYLRAAARLARPRMINEARRPAISRTIVSTSAALNVMLTPPTSAASFQAPKEALPINTVFNASELVLPTKESVAPRHAPCVAPPAAPIELPDSGSIDCGYTGVQANIENVYTHFFPGFGFFCLLKS